MPTEGDSDSTAVLKPAVVSTSTPMLASPQARSTMRRDEGGDSRVRSGSNSSEASSKATTNGGRRGSSRRASFVVYPENADEGKPKVFARQSFVVSGEEEEMAETILKARQLAGERRRSTFTSDPKVVASDKKAAAEAAACTLAARRDSHVDVAKTAVIVTKADGDVKATAANAEAEKRRSSVLQRIPDNLRALVQQSDASGVQQKTSAPYVPPAHKQPPASPARPAAPSTRESDAKKAPAPTVGTGPIWLRSVMHFLRRKGGMSSKKNNDLKKRGSSDQRDGATDEGRSTPRASPMPGMDNDHALLPPQLPQFAGRKQLILDLDETLVHSSFKPVPRADYIMDIDVDGAYYKVFVLKRPGVDEFLKRVSRDYEVIVFTASLPQYANPLLDRLDPTGIITSRLFREHCTFHEGYFVKDLERVRFQTLEATIIVDNSPMAYMFQPENAIDCISWINEQDDTELWVIADFLEAIVDVPDVRDLLEFWREGSGVLQNAAR